MFLTVPWKHLSSSAWSFFEISTRSFFTLYLSMNFLMDQHRVQLRSSRRKRFCWHFRSLLHKTPFSSKSALSFENHISLLLFSHAFSIIESLSTDAGGSLKQQFLSAFFEILKTICSPPKWSQTRRLMSFYIFSNSISFSFVALVLLPCHHAWQIVGTH
jgi:hypothetical protein